MPNKGVLWRFAAYGIVQAYSEKRLPMVMQVFFLHIEEVESHTQGKLVWYV